MSLGRGERGNVRSEVPVQGPGARLLRGPGCPGVCAGKALAFLWGGVPSDRELSPVRHHPPPVTATGHGPLTRHDAGEESWKGSSWLRWGQGQGLQEPMSRAQRTRQHPGRGVTGTPPVLSPGPGSQVLRLRDRHSHCPQTRAEWTDADSASLTVVLLLLSPGG